MGIETKHPTYTTEFSQKTMDVYNGDVLDYIPRLSGQTNDEYKAYRERAALFNVTSRITTALVGAMTRKKYMLIDMDEPNIVGDMSMEEFVTVLLRDVLLTGRVGIFVDYDNELNAPYLIPYQNKDITNWSDDFIVIEEFYYAPDPNDPYNLISTPRYRELYLDDDDKYAVRLWEKNGSAKFESYDAPIPLRRQEQLTELPFVFATPYDTSRDVNKPILNNLADINLSHSKLTTDLYHGLHFTALPQAWIAGELTDKTSKLTIGTTDVWQFEEGAQVDYLEFSGNGLSLLIDTIGNTEMQMASIGSRLLETKSGVESAEALRIRNGSESASLIALIGAVESAINKALEIYNHWNGVEMDFKFTMNRDFSASTMQPADITALMGLLAANLITEETFLERLESGEIVESAEQEKLDLMEQAANRS